MITKLFGIADIFIAAIFLLSLFGDSGWFPYQIVIAAGIILLIKGLLFVVFRDFASMIDVVCSVIILSSVWISIPILLSILVIIFLVQKGIFSLIS